MEQGTTWKICVFSDSHGNSEPMVEAALREQPDYIFFLGDGERDLPDLRRKFPRLPIEAVRGNCDLYSELPADLICSVGGVRFFITHGHRYGVKTDRQLDALKYAARKARAKIALFGHTHSPYLEETDGLLLLNPGSIGRWSPSYAVLEIENGQNRPRLESV